MDFESTSDARLAARAVRGGWPMPPETLEKALSHLRLVAADPTARPRARAQARKALESVEDPESLPDGFDDLETSA